MPTLLVTHPACAGHAPPDRHPERVARLAAVLDALAGEGFERLTRAEAPRADRMHLRLAHPESHIAAMEAAMPREGYTFVDDDTVASPGTWQAALRAAGAGILAVDEVMAGRAVNAFCAVRPPGHHAEAERAMGFCFFNNAAIAARHAQAAHGVERVAVVDFDVHHGNGTQDIFAPHADLFYASTHQHPLYPGTGAPDETGIAHNILNVPLAPGAGGEAFRAAYEGTILPALDAFAPGLVIVSAGFDGHARDPLAEFALEDADFGWITAELCALAARHCEGRLVSLLEGGYDLEALASASRAHVAALVAAR